MPKINLAQSADPAGTWLLRDGSGNPRGEVIDTRIYTGKPAFTWNTNTAGVAASNTAALMAHYTASPSSGVNVEVDGFLAIDAIVNPKRIIGNREQHLAFSLTGKAGATILCRTVDDHPLYFDRPGFTSHRPSGVARIKIADIDFLTKTPMVFEGLAQELTLDNVVCVSESKDVAYHFSLFYGWHAGKVYALDCEGGGFRFLLSNQVTADFLSARKCGGDAFTVVGCQRWNPTIDAEANDGWALTMRDCKNCKPDGWIEGNGPRVRLERCEDIDHEVDGWRIDEADRYSRVMCPALFAPKVTPIDYRELLWVGQYEFPEGVYRIPLPGFDQCGVELTLRVTGYVQSTDENAGKRAGWIRVNSNGNSPCKETILGNGVIRLRGYVESSPGVEDFLEIARDVGAEFALEILEATRIEAIE